MKDVEKAQVFYRDKLGFKISWLIPEKTFGAVSKDEAAIFLRQHDIVTPITIWIFVDDVDKTYKEFVARSVPISEAIESKPWNQRQFAIQDPDGNKFIFHHEI